MSALTLVQQQVLILLAQGSTVSAAAQQTGVHRNTIANWRRSSSGFRDTWASVQYEQAQYWRDEMQSLGALAVQTLRDLLTDEKASPSIRLRAALAVLDKISTPAPTQPEYATARRQDAQVDQALETLLGPLPKPGQALAGLAPEDGAPEDGIPNDRWPKPQPVQKENPPTAQSCTTHNSGFFEPKPFERPIYAALVPNNSLQDAQGCTTVRHKEDQPGRNAPCPCGSGVKFKRCCLGKPAARAA